MKSYADHIGEAPEDELSKEWVQWFIDTNTQNGTLLQHDDSFMIARNYKFVNGDPDRKYARKIVDAIVIFPKQGVSSFEDMITPEKEQLLQYLDVYHRQGYHAYYNAPFDMTLRRMHIHLVKFKEHEGERFIPVSGKRDAALERSSK